MGNVKMKGKTVEEAVKSALEVLKVNREQVEVKVLEEGSGGILGMIGGKEAEVEVTTKESIAQQAEDLLQGILDKMGFMALANVTGEEGDNINLEIKGEDLGRIIGREGATIDALQYLVGTILSRRQKKRVRCIIDAADYRGRREKKLKKIASDAADQAITSGKEVALSPMTAAERRIIHLALQESEQAYSYSQGEGRDRHIIVAPGKKPEITGKFLGEEGQEIA